MGIFSFEAKPATRRSLRLLALAVVCGGAAIFWGAIFFKGPRPMSSERIMLLPQGKDSDGKSSRKSRGKDLPEAVGIKSFQKWKTYEDERISFRYPDHPDIRLEVKSPEDTIPVEGGRVGTADDTFSHCYCLSVGNRSYDLLLLNRSDEFDDGICFCGEVVFEKYAFHNGALFRFEFLEGGNIKKVQILGKDFRVVAFEWTHLLAPQEVYREVALSVRLKSGPCDEAAMRKLVMDKYGFKGRLGFIEKGMGKKEITDLLGPPKEESETSLTYATMWERWQTTIVIPIRDGKFRGFEENWRSVVKLPAERGSVDWIVETVMDEDKDQPDNPPKEPLSDETIKYIFNRFVEIAPSVQDGRWNRLCMAVSELWDKGHSDKRIPPIVRKRFADEIYEQHHATWILHKYDPKGSRALFAKKIRRIFDKAREPAAKEKERSPFGNNLHSLLCFLGLKSAAAKAFILEGMDHPDGSIREDIYGFWDNVPEKDARPRLLRGLEDENVWVRRKSADAFEKSFGMRKDVELLKKRLSVETEEDVLKSLKAAVERLQK